MVSQSSGCGEGAGGALGCAGAAFGARVLLSDPRFPPARARARARAAAVFVAGSTAARATRCPLLAVATTLAICPLSGALQRPVPSAAAAVAVAPVAAAVANATTAALQRSPPAVARYGIASSFAARCASLPGSVASVTLSVMSPAR